MAYLHARPSKSCSLRCRTLRVRAAPTPDGAMLCLYCLLIASLNTKVRTPWDFGLQPGAWGFGVVIWGRADRTLSVQTREWDARPSLPG